MRIIFAGLAILSSVTSHATLDSEALLKEISKKGPKAVVKRIYSDLKLENELFSKIESGDEKWLNVAKKLRKGSDAGSSTSLDMAVARALPNNPKGVLDMIGKDFTFERVCGLPFIEPEQAVVDDYIERAHKALSTIATGPLVSVAKQCRQRIAMPN